MKKKFIQYIFLTTSFIILIIFYLSVFGIETEKFNNQIKDKVAKIDNNLEIELKRSKITLDPFNFKIKAKTIGANILYKDKKLELEYIQASISLKSIFENKLVSSNFNISTKSILLKDLIAFIRGATNKTELFFIERAIKSGHIITDINLNFDDKGKIKDDYKINGTLKNGKINLLKNQYFENINFLYNINKDVFNLKDLNFKLDKTDFFSNYLKITNNKKDFLFTGDIKNKKSILDDSFFKLIKLDLKYFDLLNTKFATKNNFSFKIDERFRLKDLVLDSEIDIFDSEYKKPAIFDNYFTDIKNIIYLKNHKIKAKYKKNYLSLIGSGKIKLKKEFDDIEYSFIKKDLDLRINSKIFLSELNVKNKLSLKKFIPKINRKLKLKNNEIKINYKKDNLLIEGLGEIQLENDFEKINYNLSKSGKKLNFDTKLNLDNTSLEIDILNFKKNEKLKSKLRATGSYEKSSYLNLEEFSISSEENKIFLKNLALNKDNKILKIDELDLNYVDTENKKNQLIIKKKGINNYILNGSIFNANTLISDLLKSKGDDQFRILKNDININMNLKEVFFDKKNIVSDLKAKIFIKNNKVFDADIEASLQGNKNLNFSIKTKNNEKVTTLFSSKAKLLVDRYKFIKGFEDGYLDFYSSKKGKSSQAKLKIYDFKLKEMPILTKLLTLASLQGIADILSGEGIRFDEFEMNFKNEENLLKIDEIYAIGPAISILMSGYVEKDKIISLRGTLVPATTINKTISTIPILGKILVGDKTGEGVFGVSFKIKGPPNQLETTVNPIKTLTPRFITRTLEKIKKN